MRPKYFRTIRLDGTKALAAGPLDLAPGDIEVAVWARIIQYQTLAGAPVEKESLAAGAPHMVISGWDTGEMTREDIQTELEIASVRLTDVPRVLELASQRQSQDGPVATATPATSMLEFTVRNDLGPRWAQIPVTARNRIVRNPMNGDVPQEFAFRKGPAHAEAWIWVEREDDDGGTYQFSLYWNDDLALGEEQVPPEDGAPVAR